MTTVSRGWLFPKKPGKSSNATFLGFDSKGKPTALEVGPNGLPFVHIPFHTSLDTEIPLETAIIQNTKDLEEYSDVRLIPLPTLKDELNYFAEFHNLTLDQARNLFLREFSNPKDYALLKQKIEKSNMDRYYSTSTSTSTSSEPTRSTTMSQADKTTDNTSAKQGLQLLQELVGHPSLEGKEEEVTKAIMSALSDIQRTLPIESDVASHIRDFLNILNAGGDPSIVLKRFIDSQKGMWGFNIQTILAVGGIIGLGKIITDLVGKVDLAAIASALAAKSEQLKTADTPTAVSLDDDPESIEISG